jgi:hypothetical protein
VCVRKLMLCWRCPRVEAGGSRRKQVEAGGSRWKQVEAGGMCTGVQYAHIPTIFFVFSDLQHTTLSLLTLNTSITPESEIRNQKNKKVVQRVCLSQVRSLRVSFGRRSPSRSATTTNPETLSLHHVRTHLTTSPEGIR